MGVTTTAYRPRHAWAALFATTALLAAAPASAQSVATRHASKPLAQSLSGPAKAAYTEGGLLYNRGDYAAAAVKYQEAYDFSKDPRLIFNIAACEKELHAYARMNALLRRFLKEAGDDISEQDRKVVTDALAILPKYVGSVTVVVDTPGADVAVDGMPVGTTPLASAITLDPGKHVIRVHKDGAEPVDRPVDVRAAEATTVSVALGAPAPASAPVPAASPVFEQPEAPVTAPASGGYRPLVYGGFGLAVVGVVVGGVAGALSIADESSVSSACKGLVCPMTVDGDLRSARTLGDVSTVAFAAAGVGAIVGVVSLFVLRHPSAPARAGFSVTPWIGPSGAGVDGSF